jgi:hypothetical protein
MLLYLCLKQVAQNIGLNDTSEVWMLVKALYGDTIEPRKLDILGWHSPPSPVDESSSDEDSDSESVELPVSSNFSIPCWNPNEAVNSLLSFQLECGNIQLCVALVLALGGRVKIPQTKDWVMIYGQMLRRFNLHIQATELEIDVSLADLGPGMHVSDVWM